MPQNPDPPEGGPTPVDVPEGGRSSTPEEVAAYKGAVADFLVAMGKIIEPLYPQLVGRPEVMHTAVLQAAFQSLLLYNGDPIPSTAGALGCALAGASFEWGEAGAGLLLYNVNAGWEIGMASAPPIARPAAGTA